MNSLASSFLSALLLASLLSGCASTSYLRPGFQMGEVKNLTFAPPVSAVAIVRTGYQTVVDSQATATSIGLLHKLLVRHRYQLHLRHELKMPDSLRLAARREIYQAVEGIKAHPRLTGGARLPVLDYVLDTQNRRYALLTAAAGFTQEVTKYDLRQAQSTGVGQFAITRTPSPRPVVTRAKSNLFLFIYDRQQQAIVYYTSSPASEYCQPLDEASLEEQFNKMLRKDFPITVR